MSTRNAELLMAVSMLVFSLGLMWNIHSDGLVIGWMEARGPGSGLWPFWLSLGMALCSVWTVIRWFNGTTAESRDDSPYMDPESFGLVVISCPIYRYLSVGSAVSWCLHEVCWPPQMAADTRTNGRVNRLYLLSVRVAAGEIPA